MIIIKITKQIPNAITLLNVLAGCFSIVFAFDGSIYTAGILIFAAAVFDFADGLTARLLNAYSELGKQLDSLADAISFGVAPSVIGFLLLKNAMNINTYYALLPLQQKTLLTIPFIMALFSVLRLAKFNIDSRQTDSFIGLPTPANAIMWASFPIAITLNAENLIFKVLLLPQTIIGLSVLMSVLLVSNISLFSLKFKSLSFTQNKIRYIFLALCIISFIVFKFYSIPVILLLYIILSLFSVKKTNLIL